jgi:hypothetical protein
MVVCRLRSHGAKCHVLIACKFCGRGVHFVWGVLVAGLPLPQVFPLISSLFFSVLGSPAHDNEVLCLIEVAIRLISMVHKHLSKTFTNFFFSSISLFTAQTWAGLSVISKPPGLTVILLTENQTLENVLPPVTQIAPLAVATFIPFLSPSNGNLISLSTDDSCYNNSHSILLHFLVLEWYIPY